MTPLLALFRLASTACGTNTGFLPSLYDPGKNGSLCPNGRDLDIKSVSDVLVIVGNVVRIIIALSGAIAVIVIIVAAIYYITSTGDPGRVKRAKDILTNTAVGLILILVSYAVVTFVAAGF